MSFRAALVAAAEREWQRFGFSERGLAGEPQRIVGREQVWPYVDYINEYWQVVGQSKWNGFTPQPWSGAFISYCFDRAGAGARFPYKSSHAAYCSEIVRNPAAYPNLHLHDVASQTPVEGDLVVAARSGKDCSKPPSTHAEALAWYQAGKRFCSHADIVVDRGDRWIEVIGGNVADSVTRVRYATDGNGRIMDARVDWIAVVEVGL